MSYQEDPDFLSQEEIEEIHEEYRQKRLLEALVGPSVSTVFHILLIVLLAIFIRDKFKDVENDIEIVVQPIDNLPPIEVKPEIPEIEKELKEVEVTTPLNVASLDPEINEKALEENEQDEPEIDNDLADDTITDVEVSPSTFATIIRGGDSNGGKQGTFTQYGLDPSTYGHFLKCLEWLAKVQNADGSWGSDARAGYTGLALLTFLAHGEMPTSKRYGKTVKKAMQWLVQDKIDTKSHHAYPHAIKTYALSEAYAMTGLSLIEGKMNECVEVIVKGQQEHGCFDYNYKSSEARQDLSFAGWNYQALKAASIAGCEVRGLDEAIYKSLEYLKMMGEAEKSYAYTTSNNDPDQAKGAGKWTMKAVGSLCLQLLEPGQHKILDDELDSILKEGVARFNWNRAPGRSLYGWYYETNAMFHAQGKYWKGWKDTFSKVLRENQHEDGYWIYPGNSRMPGDDLSHKVYATTLAALMLSVPFRYLPSSKVQVSAVEVKKAKMKTDEVMKEEGIDLIK